MNIPLDKYEEFYVCDGHVYLHGEGVESMLIDGNRKVEQETAANLARVAAEIRPT
jgi:hypothetical protein